MVPVVSGSDARVSMANPVEVRMTGTPTDAAELLRCGDSFPADRAAQAAGPPRVDTAQLALISARPQRLNHGRLTPWRFRSFPRTPAASWRGFRGFASVEQDSQARQAG